jgi:hypothetical protein
MVFFLDEENYYKALAFLESRKKTSPLLQVETDRGTLSLGPGKTSMLNLDGEPVGRICFNMYGDEEHIVTDTLYLPLTPPQEGAKPITWTLKKK